MQINQFLLKDPILGKSICYTVSEDNGDVNKIVRKYMDFNHPYFEVENYNIFVNKTQEGLISQVQVSIKCLGGKRGFESLLKKEALNKKKFTDNSNARDLDGRLLKDVKDEIRLKKWVQEEGKREETERMKKIHKK